MLSLHTPNPRSSVSRAATPRAAHARARATAPSSRCVSTRQTARPQADALAAYAEPTQQREQGSYAESCSRSSASNRPEQPEREQRPRATAAAEGPQTAPANLRLPEVLEDARMQAEPQPAGPSPAAVRKWRRRLADEKAEGRVYRSLAGRRSGEEREILLGLGDAGGRQAAHWAKLLGEQAGEPGAGDIRMRALGWLARHFGSVFVLALVQRSETRSPYDTDADATPAIAADERMHEEGGRGAAARGRARVSGTFRAAVFGANDGLVSNLALVLGVSGGGVSTQAVLLTGLSGLLAGALSMGAGEYVSVRSQRELLAASAPDPNAHTAVPKLDVDANELALVYRARGMGA